MFATKASPLAVTAWLSLAVSLVLGAMPFVVPAVPTGPVIVANWVLFMLVGYLPSPKPLRFLPPFKKMERSNFRLWTLVFIAFTAAGWIAIFNETTVT
jgi:hypothetical protein